jgi:ABC-type Fe3+/spermidine/putrescine transport system ATPase subunit
VTLHVEDKEYVCILGPSGCGKSTLIKCVAGIIHPDRGQILIDGQPIQRIAIEDRNIGYVFQEIALFPHLTVRDNVSYGLAVRAAAPERTTTVTNEMLDLINMRERSKSLPRELSGGAQQKVAVARAIATGSHLFLLDEPLGALDALVRAELRYELKRLALDLGLTIIHVTHDQEEALSIADRVVVMKQGRVVEVGKPSDIYLSPKNLFTENFVGETNLLEGKVAKADGASCLVDVNDREIRISGAEKKVGERIVVAVRPEFIQLVPNVDENKDGWEGRIKQATFLGGINRYVVKLQGEDGDKEEDDEGYDENEDDEQEDKAEGLELVVHVPISAENKTFREGDRVKVLLADPEHMLLFDYPTEGLEKETALE